MTAADPKLNANTVRILRESLDNAAEAFTVDGRHVLAREMRRNLAALDALQTQAERPHALVLSDLYDRAEAAEAERDHAHDALREIVDSYDETVDGYEMFVIARAALGDSPA